MICYRLLGGPLDGEYEPCEGIALHVWGHPDHEYTFDLDNAPVLAGVMLPSEMKWGPRVEA